MSEKRRWNFNGDILDDYSIPDMTLWYDHDDPNRPVSLTIETDEDYNREYGPDEVEIHLEIDEVETLATFLMLALSAARRQRAGKDDSNEG